MKKVCYYRFLIIYVKMSEVTYYRKNREIILNRTKEYYENNTERFL